MKWPMLKLGEVLTPVSQDEAVEPLKTYRLLGVRLDGRGPFLRETVLGSQSAANKLFRVATGEFIYSRLFACRGAFGVISAELDNCYVSGEFPTFSPVPHKLDVNFLSYWFRLPSTLANVDARCSGSTPLTRNRFKEKFFLNLEIPLPPLLEQRQIVEKIERLARKIGEAQGLREESAASTEAFFLSSIETTYQSLGNQVGVSPLGDICTSVTDGDHLTPVFTPGGVRFIFVGNVSTGCLHFENCKYVDEDYFHSLSPKRIPERGDVLYSAVGATLGVPAVVETDERFCFQRHVAILKPDRGRIESRYLWYMLQSPTVFQKAWSSATGSAQPTVPLRAIRVLPLPVPSLPEQWQVRLQLDELRTKTDFLRRLQGEARRELNAMIPSILDKAFKGQL